METTLRKITNADLFVEKVCAFQIRRVVTETPPNSEELKRVDWIAVHILRHKELVKELLRGVDWDARAFHGVGYQNSLSVEGAYAAVEDALNDRR